MAVVPQLRQMKKKIYLKQHAEERGLTLKERYLDHSVASICCSWIGNRGFPAAKVTFQYLSFE